MRLYIRRYKLCSQPYSYLAAKTFNKFRDSFLNELHVEINTHNKQEAAGLAPQPMHGITVHDSEVLAPEPVRQGGLMRKDAVSVVGEPHSHPVTLIWHADGPRNMRLKLPQNPWNLRPRGALFSDWTDWL